ncbi:MAG: hypothetical protein K8S27_00635 [Candidatus Omnitrophica bacterium]|nr:hypothetical protein [Candidatus Omnitrophota bacterium]
MKKQWVKYVMVVGLLFVYAATAGAQMVSTTKRAKKYHKHDCPFMQKIKNKDYILKMDKKEAIKMGKQPCGRCYREDLEVSTDPIKEKVSKKGTEKNNKTKKTNKTKTPKKK